MELPRRSFLRLTAGAVMLPTVSHFAMAQAYPAQPVRLVVGYAAGGGNDIIARLMGQWLTERLGQPFVIENRPGANSNVGTEAVVRAPPDGYTLLLVSASNATNATLYDNLSFNFIRDIAPVAGLLAAPSVMVVHPSVPANTVAHFIAYARANPGKINLASGGNGSPSHLAGELFKVMTGVSMLHVPYRGLAPALVDLLGGQVQVAFGALTSSIEYIRTGKLRALAVTATARSEALPDLPTVAEFVPSYESRQWYGIGAPKDTSAGIVEKLNKEINAGLSDSKIKGRLANLGGVALALSPADFGKLIADETEKWGKVIRTADIKPE